MVEIIRNISGNAVRIKLTDKEITVAADELQQMQDKDIIESAFGDRLNDEQIAKLAVNARKQVNKYDHSPDAEALLNEASKELSSIIRELSGGERNA